MITDIKFLYQKVLVVEPHPLALSGQWVLADVNLASEKYMIIAEGGWNNQDRPVFPDIMSALYIMFGVKGSEHGTIPNEFEAIPTNYAIGLAGMTIYVPRRVLTIARTPRTQ